MRIVKIVLGVIAALAVLMGGVWILQGLNILPGSYMTGDMNWAYRGGIMVVAGAAVLYWAIRQGGPVKGIAGVFGVLFMLMGGTWILQGLNVLPGSFMTGDITWTYYGAVIAIAGAALVWWANRKASAA